MSDLSNIGMCEQSVLSEEITSDDVADPTPLPRVCGANLLVRPVNTRSDKVKTKSGVEIFLPDQVVDDVSYLVNVGRVLEIGPRAYKTREDKEIEWAPGGLKVGDFVQWNRHVGKRFRYKGVNLVLLKDVDIQFVVDDPQDLDTFANIED